MKDLKAMLPSGLFGYRKEAVEDYIRRLESELSICEERSRSAEKQTAEVNRELEKALAQLRSQDGEVSLLHSRNTALDNEVRDLEGQLRNLESQLKQTETRYEQLKKETETSEYSPKQIQDVLLRAQKTADSIVDDAQAKAQEIAEEAEDLRLQKAQEGESILTQAKADADAVTGQMRRDCETIRQDIAGAKMTGVAYKRKMKGILQELLGVVDTIPEMDDAADSVEAKAEQPADGAFRVLKVN